MNDSSNSPTREREIEKLPLVSVAIPIFNGEKYLPECLESIRMQTYPRLEILVSDDRSADGSLEIVRRHATRDSRIRWWQNDHNLGLTGNHNICLRQARGEFVKFVHQDDRLLSSAAVQKLAGVLIQNSTVALAASASHVIDQHSELISRRCAFKTGIWNGRQVVLNGFETVANPIGEPSVVMFRKAQAQRGFLTEYRHLWDLEMWCHLLEQGSFAFIAEPLCAFRKHDEQQSDVNRRDGIIPGEMLTLLEAYYAKPWLHEMATQRMLVNQHRFLKKNARRLGPRADRLIAEMEARIRPGSSALFWLHRKFRQPFDRLRVATARAASRFSSGH